MTKQKTDDGDVLRPADIEVMVAEIDEKKFDDEDAHRRETGMLWRIVNAIANNKCDLPESCCKAALKSRDIEFSRWYA